VDAQSFGKQTADAKADRRTSFFREDQDSGKTSRSQSGDCVKSSAAAVVSPRLTASSPPRKGFVVRLAILHGTDIAENREGVVYDIMDQLRQSIRFFFRIICFLVKI
jgi:hypothetical protein